MQSGSVLPFWVVAPLALVTMLIVAGHLMAMRSVRAGIPASRYRIRMVNGALILTLTPMLAFAFGVVPPAEQKLFTLIWICCIGLMGIVIVLALLDGLNSVRLGRVAARRLREEHASAIASLRGDRTEGSDADG